MSNSYWSKKLGNTFLKSRYFKDIFNQAGLVIIAQLIPIIFSPYISRIYDENAMAEITGLMVFSGLLLVFSTLKLENAIIIAKDNEQAKQILSLSALVALCFSFITGVLVFFFGPLIGRVFEIQNVVYIAPLYILFFSFLNILNFWFVRLKKFKMKAYSKIIENLSYVLFAILLYYLIDSNEYGLAIGKMVGVVVAFILLVTISGTKLTKHSIKSHLNLLVSFKEFPLHYVPSSFVNVFSLQLLAIFIGVFFTKEELGFFGLANMVILLPISFVTQSVGSIFFKETTDCINQRDYQRARLIFYKTFKMLIAIGFPVFLILFLGSVYLFPFIFGDNWQLTGQVAKPLSIVFLVQFVVGPISICLISLKKLKLNAIWQYGRFIIMIVYMIVLIYYFKMSFLEFVKWYSYGAASLYLIYFLIINNEIRKLGNDDQVKFNPKNE